MTSKADLELVKGIMQGNLTAVIGALDAGADFESPDVHGFSGFPLRVACSRGDGEIVLELLRRGAQVNSPSRDGPNGSMRQARRGKHEEIVSMLGQYGADGTDSVLDAPSATNQPSDPGLVLDAPAFEMPAAESESAQPEAEVEQVLITGCYGVDTSVLDGDLLRLSQSDVGSGASSGTRRSSEPEPESKSKFKFWKR